MPKLCLGTAQFGMDYGVTNHDGMVSANELKQILRLASEYSISHIDTARVYGDAEVRLGNNAPKNHCFNYITKLPSQSTSAWNSEILEHWEYSLNASLRSLKVMTIDTLLLHSAKDLMHQQSQLLADWLFSLKTRQIVRNIGVSIYNSDDLECVDFNLFNVVQLPLSIYDQRCLLDGTIDFLHSRKIQVFARSIFLQGLILTDPNMWPKHFDNAFRHHHRLLLDFLHNISQNPLEAALSFMYNIDQLTGVIVGINSLAHFKEILNMWVRLKPNSSNLFSTFHWHNAHDLDPRNWPSK
jgi:aryl-alcohol dehydrogenase-like predicted oxidoreductase